MNFGNNTHTTRIPGIGCDSYRSRVARGPLDDLTALAAPISALHGSFILCFLSAKAAKGMAGLSLVLPDRMVD